MISISSFFSEPGSYFSISYKVHVFINEVLMKEIFYKFNLKDKLNGYDLFLCVATNSLTKEVEIRGTDKDPKNKVINWGLWLPYLKVVEAEDQRAPYLKYLFDAIVLVLHEYAIPEEPIRAAEEIVRREVIGNPSYFEEVEVDEEIDLSDLNLDEPI
jgi:hypothetical protein